MRRGQRLFSCFVLMFLLCLGTACPSKEVQKKTISDEDKTFELTVPGGWKKMEDLNERADLQAGSRLAQLFVIVLVDGKEDLADLSLEDHSNITRMSLLESLRDVEVSQPKKLTIDNKPALQFEIRGTMDHVKIVYLHTTVESPTHFYQILAWTVPSRWKKDHETLRKVTNYFHELKP